MNDHFDLTPDQYERWSEALRLLAADPYITLRLMFADWHLVITLLDIASQHPGSDDRTKADLSTVSQNLSDSLEVYDLSPFLITMKLPPFHAFEIVIAIQTCMMHPDFRDPSELQTAARQIAKGTQIAISQQNRAVNEIIEAGWQQINNWLSDNPHPF